MKIIILGGSGFVGSRLARALQKTQHEVFSFSRSSGLDIRDYAKLKKILEEIQPDAIVNCAAVFGNLNYLKKFEADILHDNMQMILNTYRAVGEACPSARIVNPVANCSYPGNTSIQKEIDWLDGPVHESVRSYGNAKRFIFLLAQCYHAQYGLKTVNFLVPNIFGPGNHVDMQRVHALDGMIIRMIQAQRNNESQFEIWGSGKPIREWIYIDDLVKILQAGLTMTQELIQPINIAQGRGYTIQDSAEKIADILGYKGTLVYNTSYPDGDPKKVLDNSKFKQYFPNFRFIDHTEGLKKTIEYYLSR